MGSEHNYGVCACGKLKGSEGSISVIVIADEMVNLIVEKGYC